MTTVVIVSGMRTPIGRYLGALRDVSAYELGALVLKEAVAKIGIEPAVVDEVIMDLGATAQESLWENAQKSNKEGVRGPPWPH